MDVGELGDMSFVSDPGGAAITPSAQNIAAPSTTMTTMLLKLVSLNRAQDGLGLAGRNGSTR
jgi:hypothetical protein